MVVNEKNGQYSVRFKQYLKDNPEVCAVIESKVREHYGIAAEPEAENVKSTSKKSKED